MFWTSRPLNKEIQLETLSLKTTGEKFFFKFYKKYRNIHILHSFIALHYRFSMDTFHFDYSLRHLEFFLENGFWVSLHSSKFPDEIIGVICGRFIQCGKEKTSEIDFLCVVEKLRKLNLSPLLIDYATKYITENGINTSFFTGMTDRGNYFCKKHIYIRPLNVKRLKSAGYMDIDIKNSFDYKPSLTASVVLDDAMAKEISCRYKVFRNETKYDDSIFLNFIVRENGIACGFYSFMKIHTRKSIDKQILNMVILYNFKIQDAKDFTEHLQCVSKRLLISHQIDSITMYEPIDNLKATGYLIKTPYFLYHYCYNKKLGINRPEEVEMTPI